AATALPSMICAIPIPPAAPIASAGRSNQLLPPQPQPQPEPQPVRFYLEPQNSRARAGAGARAGVSSFSFFSACASTTPMKTLLVANRGEIAVRIMHAAAELGLRTVAVYSEDDAGALHMRRADAARPLRGIGVAAYLEIDQLLAIAAANDCDAIHPGYGFLSENAAF